MHPLDEKLVDAEHNVVSALIKWVEEDVAPEKLIGTKYRNDDVSKEILAQRTHCVYPKHSKWNRKDDWKEASSWDCV